MLNAVGKFDVVYNKALNEKNLVKTHSMLGKALKELYDAISKSDLIWKEKDDDLSTIKYGAQLFEELADLFNKFFDLKAKKASENEIDDMKAECYAKLYEARPVFEKLNVIRKRLITVGVAAKAKA